MFISTIHSRLTTVWDGKLRWTQKLDSKIKSQYFWDSIHSMTGDIRQCGCFQVCLNIHSMIQYWNRIKQRHYITQWRVWCMLSRLMVQKLKLMRRNGRERLQSLKVGGGGQMPNLGMGTTGPDSNAECTPHWSRVDWGKSTNIENPSGEIHFTGSFRSMEGS